MASFNPASTNYPASYLGGFGFTADQAKQLQDSGVTLGDLSQLGVIGRPDTQMSQPQTYSGAQGQPFSTPQLTNMGRGQMQNATMLKVMMALGGGGKSNAPATPLTSAQMLQADPGLGINAIGAAALGEPLAANQQPGQADVKSGVGGVGKPMYSSDIPGTPGGLVSRMPGVFTAAPMPLATGQIPPVSVADAQNYFAQQAGSKMGTIKPSEIPADTAVNYYNAMHPELAAQQKAALAVQPAPQATAAAYNPIPAPFAQAPAAPGISPLAEAHTSALADAGRALYAHYGGDPNSATPEDIFNFHNQLTAGLGGGWPGGGPPPGGGGAPPAAASQGAPVALAAGPPAAAATKEPVKMQSGGWVSGNGDDDTVPAYLTPGEYVIPKEQAQRLRERPRQMPAQPAQTSAAAPPNTGGTSSGGGSTAPAAPGGYTGPSAAQLRASANATANTGSWGIDPGVGDPDPDAPYLAQAGAINKNAVSGAAGVASGLASGLASAAKAYADSIKPWTMQKSAIPNPDDFKRQQPITFGPVGA